MLTHRDRSSLDAYITGHYGEDQFKGMPCDAREVYVGMRLSISHWERTRMKDHEGKPPKNHFLNQPVWEGFATIKRILAIEPNAVEFEIEFDKQPGRMYKKYMTWEQLGEMVL